MNKIYTIQDPSSQQTYDFQLDHRPSYYESMELIKSEQLKRSQAELSQHETNDQTEEESQPLSTQESISHQLAGFGKDLGNQVIQSPVVQAIQNPNLQNYFLPILYRDGYFCFHYKLRKPRKVFCRKSCET